MHNTPIDFKFKVLFMSLMMLLMSYKSSAQETELNETSIRTGFGIGSHDGIIFSEFGYIYSFGWQNSFGKKNKLRLNPNFLLGKFSSFGTLDIMHKYKYTIYSLGLNLHYDLIKYKSVSIVTTVGSFINYSRGFFYNYYNLEDTNNRINYFRLFDLGGNASIGIRVNPKNSRLAYELRPIDLQLSIGNEDFILGYSMIGIDFKLNK